MRIPTPHWHIIDILLAIHSFAKLFRITIYSLFYIIGIFPPALPCFTFLFRVCFILLGIFMVIWHYFAEYQYLDHDAFSFNFSTFLSPLLLIFYMTEVVSQFELFWQKFHQHINLVFYLTSHAAQMFGVSAD